MPWGSNGKCFLHPKHASRVQHQSAKLPTHGCGAHMGLPQVCNTIHPAQIAPPIYWFRQASKPHSPKVLSCGFWKQLRHMLCLRCNSPWITTRPVQGVFVSRRWLAKLVCQPQGGERSTELNHLAGRDLSNIPHAYTHATVWPQEPSTTDWHLSVQRQLSIHMYAHKGGTISWSTVTSLYEIRKNKTMEASKVHAHT